MPAPFEVIASLEGLAATFTHASGNLPQAVSDWVEACKTVMRNAVDRNKTDWDFVSTSIDLDETEEEIDTGAVTLYGVLGIVKAEAQDVIFSWYNVATGTNPTVASTDLNDGGQLSGSFVVPSASASITAARGIVIPGGQVLSAGLKIAASERDEGTAIAADSCQAFVLWRTN